jgi:DNA mismatch repair ATPase MutL
MLNLNSANFFNNISKLTLLSKISLKNKNNNYTKVKANKKGLCNLNYNSLIITKRNELKKEDLKTLYIIGQFHNKLIITMRPNDSSIIIFDQHAVHERILYEFYSQLLFLKIYENDISNLNFNEVKINLFEKIFDEFNLKNFIEIKASKYNINMEIFCKKFNCNLKRKNKIFHFSFIYNIEKDTLIFFSVPIIFDKVHKFEKLLLIFSFLVNDIEYYLNLYNEKSNRIIYLFDDFIKSKACRDAVKFNDNLEDNFIKNLIYELGNCNNPFQCAHGRHNFFIKYKHN